MSSLHDNTATSKNTDQFVQYLRAQPLVLHGHTNWITSVAFLPGGTVISHGSVLRVSLKFSQWPLEVLARKVQIEDGGGITSLNTRGMQIKKRCQWSALSGKAKVMCTAIYGQHVTSEQQLDQEQISTGQRDSPRDLSAITGSLWATAQNDTHRIWLVSQPTTLLCHLRNCDLHNPDVCSRAQQEYHESYSPHKGNPGYPVRIINNTVATVDRWFFIIQDAAHYEEIMHNYA
ncbi:hypothetical protein BU15DRAFT_66385 [Melanogaster broomeanus]|nr:hypothetical protein BU15DRAFT_66385 [Melanogaster broomeanus]